MIYVYSTAAGLLYGALMGGLKYTALWRKILTAGPETKITAKTIYTRMPIDYGINVLTFGHIILSKKYDHAAQLYGHGYSGGGKPVARGKVFSVRRVFSRISPEAGGKISTETGAEEAEND